MCFDKTVMIRRQWLCHGRFLFITTTLHGGEMEPISMPVDDSSQPRKTHSKPVQASNEQVFMQPAGTHVIQSVWNYVRGALVKFQERRSFPVGVLPTTCTHPIHNPHDCSLRLRTMAPDPSAKIAVATRLSTSSENCKCCTNTVHE